MQIPKLVINGKSLRLPIIQGGMGIKVSMSGLALASIKSGIAGVISSAQAAFGKFSDDKDGYGKKNPLEANLEAMREEISLVRKEAPQGVLGVNVMHALHDYAEHIKFLATQDIDFVVSGAGLALDLPALLGDSKVKPAVILSSARAAKIICKKWKKYGAVPEFIVIEGPLAGGHLGFSKKEMESGLVKDLEDIVVEVKEAIAPFEQENNREIPIIAAGGVYTGEDIAKFIKLGCAGVQMATRFIATYECDVHENYKKALIEATEDMIVPVSSPAGLPGKAIKNSLTEHIKSHNIDVTKCVRCLKPCSVKDIPYCITEKLGAATVRGDVENGLLFTGALGYRVDKMMSVQELVDELEEGLLKSL